MKKYISQLILTIISLLVMTTLSFAHMSEAQWLFQLPKDSTGLYIPEGARFENGLSAVYQVSQPETASATAYGAIAIATQTLVSNGTSWTLALGNYTNTITPRNLVFAASFATGGGGTKTFTGSAYITGVDTRGNAITETINFTTNTGTGLYAYSSITSIVCTASAIIADPTFSADNVTINIGSGVKIGLPFDCLAATDILKVIENKALSTTYTLNTTYDTISFAASPDGSKHYSVFYLYKKR